MTRLLFFAFLLSSCVTAQKAPHVYLGGASYLTLPKSGEVLVPLRAVQIISVNQDDSTKVFEAILEQKPDQLTLSILTPLWPTPLKVLYKDEKIVVDEALKNIVPVDFKYVLADLVLVFAKSETLQKFSNHSTRIEQKGLVRMVMDISRETPQEIVEITYENEDPLKGFVQLQNLVRHYRIEVKTLKVEKL